jgi:peptide/nickel transport system permease protein
MKKRLLRPPVVILAAFICFLIFAPHQNYLKTDVLNTFAAPSSSHWLGTDNLGRDVYALLLAGGIRTLEVVGIATAISFLGGTLLGMLAGYYGGLGSDIIQFLSDFSMVIPSFIVAMTMSSLFGFHVVMAGIVFGIGHMGSYLNQACILTQSLKAHEFIASEQILGLSHLQIIFFHIFPNICRQLFVFMGNKAATVVNLYAGLAFIGLGTDITNPDWGTLLYQYRTYLTSYPLLVLWPALFIAVLTICLHATFDSSSSQEGDLTLYD